MTLSEKKRRLRVLVTAGPTREKIDPVRFISNYSTGKFGCEIASAALARGHSVTLILGPAAVEAPRRAKTISVESALEMRRAVLAEFRRADALIMAAAICDWRPAVAAKRKIKKEALTGRKMRLRLARNPDILAEAARRKGARIVVGFALETEDLIKNAAKKLAAKKVDLIVANMLSGKKTVFGDAKTDFVLIDKSGAVSGYKHCSKTALARRIIDKVEAMCYSSL